VAATLVVITNGIQSADGSRLESGKGLEATRMKITNRVKGIAMVGMALAAVALSSTDAFAAVQWNPQNTVEPVSVVALNGNTYLQFTDNKNNWVRCTSTSGTYAEAPTNGNAAVAHTTNSSGTSAAPSFSGCTSNLGSASVSCSTSWNITAQTTTSVDVSNVSCTITITPFVGSCTITMSNQSVSGNTWDNTTSTLTANSGQSITISETGTVCDGATSATETGKVQVGSPAGSVTIG
jgi:hypothetical protein